MCSGTKIALKENDTDPNQLKKTKTVPIKHVTCPDCNYLDKENCFVHEQTCTEFISWKLFISM